MKAPWYAEVAGLFNVLEVRAADACMEDVSPFFSKKRNGMDQD